MEDKFEDTKEVISIRKSKKDRQHNGQKKGENYKQRSTKHYTDKKLSSSTNLTKKLLSQGFLMVKLKSSLGKFYGQQHDLVSRKQLYVSQMTTDMFHLS
jgi:hypothetical protein